MSLSTRDFQLLTVLANELHFGRAADALGMRQPQLSTRLAQIERSVGVDLFVRRPRVAVTPAGKIVMDAARRAFNDFEAAAEQARRVERGEVGAVVTAISSSIILSDIPGSIRKFRNRYPEIGITLRDMHSTEQSEALRSGQIDISITREIDSSRPIRSEIIGHQRFVAFLSKDHPLAARKKLSLAHLANEPFVLFDHAIAPGLHHQINALCIRAGFTPNIVQEADEWYTVLGFVRAGFGVTIALDMEGAPDWPDVVTVPLDLKDAVAPVFLCWDESRPSASRDLLIDWLREEAKGLGQNAGKRTHKKTARKTA
ncbi:LysR family transcriptional regulator [Hyphococcus luteus]|uniref:LysR family transcriptional regulator n=1 Tax=Hyphococcus luteus TaxID=2058213 RepID=A0A2S7JZK4_9PROT|nr:LysR family transcriptional regulator [Marinicaulis flavus]PQA85683.1 LysR family transcriptional regulator [Marinicaulis flavus]